MLLNFYRRASIEYVLNKTFTTISMDIDSYDRCLKILQSATIRIPYWNGYNAEDI